VLAAGGDEEAQPYDEAYVEALEYGCRQREGSASGSIAWR